jgi:hypothetical protein
VKRSLIVLALLVGAILPTGASADLIRAGSFLTSNLGYFACVQNADVPAKEFVACFAAYSEADHDRLVMSVAYVHAIDLMEDPHELMDKYVEDVILPSGSIRFDNSGPPATFVVRLTADLPRTGHIDLFLSSIEWGSFEVGSSAGCAESYLFGEAVHWTLIPESGASTFADSSDGASRDNGTIAGRPIKAAEFSCNIAFQGSVSGLWSIQTLREEGNLP